jgi:selenocysteine-specific elongation factor
VLTDPVAVVKGDHFIIRSPNDTIGGGVIIDIRPARHKRFKDDVIEQLKSMNEGSQADLVMATLETKQPMAMKAVSVECNVPAADVQQLIGEFVQDEQDYHRGDPLMLPC